MQTALDTEQIPHILKLWDDPSGRIHRQLVNALATYGRGLYEILGNISPQPSSELLREIFSEIRSLYSEEPDHLPAFHLYYPGQIVEHRRYGYRGLVVDLDFSCLAADAWYRKNASQPPKLQPWYHVLVDGSDAVTYAAESNLEPDSESAPITHPYIGHFFESYQEGIYIRNDNPWPREGEVS